MDTSNSRDNSSIHNFLSECKKRLIWFSKRIFLDSSTRPSSKNNKCNKSKTKHQSVRDSYLTKFEKNMHYSKTKSKRSANTKKPSIETNSERTTGTVNLCRYK